MSFSQPSDLLSYLSEHTAILAISGTPRYAPVLGPFLPLVILSAWITLTTSIYTTELLHILQVFAQCRPLSKLCPDHLVWISISLSPGYSWAFCQVLLFFNRAFINTLYIFLIIVFCILLISVRIWAWWMWGEEGRNLCWFYSFMCPKHLTQSLMHGGYLIVIVGWTNED